MIRRPPRSTRTDTLFPYPTLFRSHEQQAALRQFCLLDQHPLAVRLLPVDPNHRIGRKGLLAVTPAERALPDVLAAARPLLDAATHGDEPPAAQLLLLVGLR